MSITARPLLARAAEKPTAVDLGRPLKTGRVYDVAGDVD